MTKLQQIVKKAKEIRKAHPKKYAKWTDYIKAASKSLSGLDSVKRSGNKTTVNYTRSKIATKKKAAPKKVVQAKLFEVKKSAPKKKMSTHKDTKSHNVNIRVISRKDLYKHTKSIANKAENQLKDIKLINSKKTRLNNTTSGTKANFLLKQEIKKLTQKYYEKYGVDVRPKHY